MAGRISLRPLRRSTVLVPAHRSELLVKGLGLAADVLLLDLQDAVPLTDAAKQAARNGADQVLRARACKAREVSVRVNGARTPWVIEDVRMAVDAGAASITVPDAHGLGDVLFFEGLVDLYATLAGVPGPGLQLEVETPGMLLELESVARHARRVDGLCVAPYDYALNLEADAPLFGGERPLGDGHLVWLRPKVVAVARAQGWNAVDAVLVADTTDHASVRAALADSRALGFDGAAVLHPSLIEIVNTAYSPGSADREWAQATLANTDNPLRQQQLRARQIVQLQDSIERGRQR